MAELARRAAERGGCLLHMVKSHRNPLKFLPALLSQAGKLTGTAFGEDAYRGDVEDLRAALVRALEMVQAKAGQTEDASEHEEMLRTVGFGGRGPRLPGPRPGLPLPPQPPQPLRELDK